MLCNPLPAVLAALLVAGPVMAQTAAPSAAPAARAAALPTVEEVIARHIAARGGMDKLKAIQSVRMNGRMTAPDGSEVPVSVEVKRPRSMRMEMTARGMTAVQAYDGTSGWMIMPFRGRTAPEPLSPEQIKDAEEMADIDGPLVDHKAKGHTVELVGVDKANASDAYKLKLTLKNGDLRYVFVDTATFMEIRNEGRRKVDGNEMEIEASFADFKKVGGVVFPHSIEQAAKGTPQRQKITIDRIEVNPPLDDSRFRMPAAAPAASPSPALRK